MYEFVLFFALDEGSSNERDGKRLCASLVGHHDEISACGVVEHRPLDELGPRREDLGNDCHELSPKRRILELTRFSGLL